MLFATGIPAILFILFQATHGAVLQHWLAPVFPSLMVAAVAAAETLPDEARILGGASGPTWSRSRSSLTVSSSPT